MVQNSIGLELTKESLLLIYLAQYLGLDILELVVIYQAKDIVKRPLDLFYFILYMCAGKTVTFPSQIQYQNLVFEVDIIHSDLVNKTNCNYPKRQQALFDFVSSNLVEGKIRIPC